MKCVENKRIKGQLSVKFGEQSKDTKYGKKGTISFKKHSGIKRKIKVNKFG